MLEIEVHDIPENVHQLHHGLAGAEIFSLELGKNQDRRKPEKILAQHFS